MDTYRVTLQLISVKRLQWVKIHMGFVGCCLDPFWHFQGYVIVLCLGFLGPTMLISTEAGQFIFFGIHHFFCYLSDNFFHWINDILVELWFAFLSWLRHYFIYWLTFIFYLLRTGIFIGSHIYCILFLLFDFCTYYILLIRSFLFM